METTPRKKPEVVQLRLRSLAIEALEQSTQVRAWLDQFAAVDQSLAMSLLARLRFVTRDEYARWLSSKLDDYAKLGVTSLFSIRKFAASAQTLWRPDGSVQPRPATTLGSEDFVASLIATAVREHEGKLLDHPSLAVLRNKRSHNIVLLDDSIGSGERAAKYIRLMANHRSFMSWWSYGLIKLHIVSYARTYQSERIIRAALPGSDHGRRKMRISDKVAFDSDYVYDKTELRRRWGEDWQAIINLCNSTHAIDRNRRRGFGDVMGNLVFFHSVPNNIPGMLWSSRGGWRAIFPNRVLPEWSARLLETQSGGPRRSPALGFTHQQVPTAIADTLRGVGRGIRTVVGLARRLDCDPRIAQHLIQKCVDAGLISDRFRLLSAGQDILSMAKRETRERRPMDRQIYIPNSWCTDFVPIQPPTVHDERSAR